MNDDCDYSLIESDVSQWQDEDLELTIGVMLNQHFQTPDSRAFSSWLGAITDCEITRRTIDDSKPAQRYFRLPTHVFSVGQLAAALRLCNNLAQMSLSEPCGKFIDACLSHLQCEITARLALYAERHGELATPLVASDGDAYFPEAQDDAKN